MAHVASAAEASPSPPGIGKVHVDKTLWIKLSEAKEFAGHHDNVDTYVTVNVNYAKHLHTKTIFNSATPLWDEEILLDLTDDFEQVDVVLWEAGKHFSSDKAVGKAVLTAKELLDGPQEQQEKWATLIAADTEGTVSGTVELKVHIAPIVDDKTVVTVDVVAGKNLVSRDVNGLSDPYVVLSVLPDPDAASTQVSKTKKKTLNPDFDETFKFSVDAPGNKLHAKAALHLTCWDWDRFTDDDFMGHFSIDLNKIPIDSKVDKTVTLQPKPVAIRETDSTVTHTAEGAKGNTLKKKDDHGKAKAFVRDFQTLTPELINVKVPGTLRLKYKFTEAIVLDIEHYSKLLKVISANSFLLPVILGKATNEREAAAWALVKTFKYYGEAVTGLNAIIDHEVQSTLDANTIFRGNSMASKGIDVYMKLIAMQYLHDTLGDAIKSLINDKKACEVDPTRLDKNDDIKKNWKHLKAVVTTFVDAILKSSGKIPADLKAIFAHLKVSVNQKFPDNKVVQYTSISGFIFLRLFVAATLSPTLFNLWPDQIDKKTGRTLTLIAKTIQNLANLVEFGQKEEYMKEMNSLINDRMPEMRKFLDEISTVDAAPSKGPAKPMGSSFYVKGTDSETSGESPKLKKQGSMFSFMRSKSKLLLSDSASSQMKQLLLIDVAKESSKLFHYFDRSKDKIVAEKDIEHIPEELIKELLAALDELRPLHAIPSN